MLGTGNALVTKCYNTCFVIENQQEEKENRYLLVDGGGGNEILTRLEKAGMDWKDMHHIFVTHKHIDHLLGIIWMMRMITQNMKQGSYEGDAYIYAHEEVILLLQDMAGKLLQSKEVSYIGSRFHMITVEDQEQISMLGRPITFFDIHSTKAKQFGFSMTLEGDSKLTCCGDEPYNDSEYKYAYGSKWLLHEAFCLYGQADIFHPYEKHHSTVKDACELAEQLKVENLLLYHTEDRNIEHRKVLYEKEGQQYYHGNLYVPEDLEEIIL